MRVLRYGETAAWAFQGFNLPTGFSAETVFLTIKDAWSSDTEEEPPNPPRLQVTLTIPPSPSPDGTYEQDDEGNWIATFELSAIETADDLGPPPRILYYEVTLVDGSTLLRPVIGSVRMLPAVYSEASS